MLFRSDMRVLVSVDMEGIAGVVDPDDVRPGFRNLLPDLLDRRALLLRGKPKPDGMLAGLAGDVDAVMFIGYHGKAGTGQSHTVVVKRALGARAAALLHPQEACDRIEQEVPRALADRDAVRPPRFDGPVEVDVDVLYPHQTERALLIPGMERPGGATLRYHAPDYPTAYRVIQLVAMLGGI